MYHGFCWIHCPKYHSDWYIMFKWLRLVLECIVTTNHNRSVLMMIITWNFQVHLMNVSILYLKYKYGAGSESCFTCYSNCCITWCPLITGIVASQCPLARDDALALPRIFYISVLKIIKNNSTTIKHIYNWFANIIEGCNNAFYTNDC